MKILILLLMSLCCALQIDFTSAQEDSQECLTPTREAGSCIHLDQCEVLFELLKDPNLTQDDRDFLNLSQCGYANNTVSVCCSTKVVDVRAGGRRFSVSQRRNNQEPYVYGSCITPNREQASCIEIEQCEFLHNLLQDPHLTRADTQFLVRSQCGYANRRVLICCPEHQRVVQRYQIPASPPQQIPTQASGRTAILPTPPVCGILLANRIYGGTIAGIDEFPWLALIEYSKPGNDKGFHCGGALISNRYVLTAAHCTKGSNISPDWRLSGVRLGEFDIRTNPDCEDTVSGLKECVPEHQDIAVENIKAHEQYDPESANKQHDIALLRLARVVTFTNFIKPICLPSAANLRSETFTGTAMDVAGWGKTERAEASNVKLKATINVWDLQDCAATYRTVNISLVRTHMCAGGEGGADSCNGDSGGPLMVELMMSRMNVYFVSGIVSFGPVKCGRRGWPGVYTRVGAYIDWIYDNVRP